MFDFSEEHREQYRIESFCKVRARCMLTSPALAPE